MSKAWNNWRRDSTPKVRKPVKTETLIESKLNPSWAAVAGGYLTRRRAMLVLRALGLALVG